MTTPHQNLVPTPPLENWEPRGYNPKVKWVSSDMLDSENEGTIVEIVTDRPVSPQDLVKQYNLLVDILTHMIQKKL